MRIIEELQDYPAIHEIFEHYKEEEYAVFLDSSLQNELGQFSIIGLYPYLKLKKGRQFTVNGQVCDSTFESYINEYLKENKEDNDTGLPLVSGAVGYFSYDYGRKMLGVKSRHESEIAIPDCILCFYDVFIIEDHINQKLSLIANGKREDSHAQIDTLKRTIAHLNHDATVSEPNKKAQVTANFSASEYMQAVDRMIRYIIEGDIYIVNMTQQLRLKSTKKPFDLFLKLRRINPSPFGVYCNYSDFQIVSASPERFLQMKDRTISTRPIKGTRKRGSSAKEDLKLKEELQNSEKDQSELLMIVDLERNDLNKVCIPGSVKVTDLFSIETYATVFHLVSNIEGVLRSNLTTMDLLHATFPGGSITGAPKLRAMEIIDQVERDSRNLYTGSMGYLSLNGDCDFNIMIRTVVYQDGTYHLGVGGGITCESELEFEYEETLQKSKAILNALE